VKEIASDHLIRGREKSGSPAIEQGKTTLIA
jgi:hypothetical protein